MGWRIKSPDYVLGANPTSGGINDGAQTSIRGGQIRGGMWSGGLATSTYPQPLGAAVAGGGGDYLFYSGAGRLNTVLPLVQMQSGQAITFYDAASVAASGAAIGGAILGVIPATWGQFSSGIPTSGALNPVIVNTITPTILEVPFYSGLCVRAQSGAGGFAFTWSPDTTPYSNVSGQTNPAV